LQNVAGRIGEAHGREQLAKEVPGRAVLGREIEKVYNEVACEPNARF